MTSTTTRDADKSARFSDRRILWHAVSIFSIILVSLLLFYKHFLTRGMLMHVDMTFPTTISRNLMLYDHTWCQYGSVQNIWNMQRVFWTYPLLGVARVLNISTDRYLLILFTSTFALAGVSMYCLAFYVIRRFNLGGTNKYAPYVGAVFAALIFMYNPWSVSHLWPYFGYPGYAVLPLVFLLLIKVVDSPKPWNVILLAVLISVAGTGPINVVWYWFMIVGYLVFYLVSKRFDRGSLSIAGKVFFPLAGLYALLNAVWIMPYTAAQVINKPFTPAYMSSFSRPMLDVLSESGTLLNNMRFTAGWGLPVNPEVRGAPWAILSFALPVLALVGFLVLRRKIVRERIVLFWSLMFVTSVLLATGTSFVLAKPYSWFVLKAPVLSSFGWVFRAADRWLVYAAVFYALMLGLLVTHLFRNRKAMGIAVAWVIIVVVLVSFAPITLSYAKNVYNPTQIPGDYTRVNKYIEDNAAGARPIWMPFAKDGFRFNWAPEKRIGAFDVYTSNASLNNLQDIFNKDNFYYWLESLFSKTFLSPGEVLNREIMLSKDVASKLFVPFSAQYMVFDSSVPGYAFGDSFTSDRSMRSVYKTENLDVFKLDASGRIVRPAPRTVSINSYYDELAVAQKLTSKELERVSFADRQARINKRFGFMDINDYKDFYDVNSGFEETDAGGRPIKWNLMSAIDSYVPTTVRQGQVVPPSLNPQPSNPRASMSIDTGTRASGKQSLRIENPSTAELSTHSAVGSEIPVAQGDIYNIETHVKYKNAEWTHVRVEGFDTNSNEWIRLARCPTIQSGTSGWKKTDCSFYMPAGISMIRPVLAAGWAKDSRKGPAISWFDDIKVSRISDRFYSDLLGGPAPPSISYKQVSPEKYEVQVRGATAPFVLAFGEAYDPLWIARVEDSKSANPVRLYSTINGFPVDHNGDFKLTIEYLPQSWFVRGLVISLVTLLLCLVYFLYDWSKRSASSISKNHSAGGPQTSRESQPKQE